MNNDINNQTPNNNNSDNNQINNAKSSFANPQGVSNAYWQVFSSTGNIQDFLAYTKTNTLS
ncbi:MAG: hypothetical protein LBM38_02155 [Clostridiales bacterium]|nr:hypothetical protein [Clostridiales bacterium]